MHAWLDRGIRRANSLFRLLSGNYRPESAILSAWQSAGWKQSLVLLPGGYIFSAFLVVAFAMYQHLVVCEWCLSGFSVAVVINRGREEVFIILVDTAARLVVGLPSMRVSPVRFNLSYNTGITTM